jgi:phage host-nuclease inhibitor protein Gam
MSKTKNKRIKLSAAPLPALNTRAEVEAAVNDIAILTLRKTRIVADMDEHIAAIREKFSPLIEIADSHLRAKTEALRDWALANPAEFGKRKSITFGLGSIGFRIGQPKLSLLSRAWNWKKALDAVRMWLPAFIRGVPEIDAEAIIAQRDELATDLPKCGLKVTQDESFYVDPNLTEIEKRQISQAA